MKYKNIAVWNTAFLGDAVLTLPLLRTLRLAWPEARLDFYVRAGLETLFHSHPDLNGVFAYAKRERGPAGLAAYGRFLRSRNYDLWVSAHRSPRSSLLAWMSRAGTRIGYAGPFLNRLCCTRVVERRFPHLHEVDRLLRLAEGLGIGEFASWPEIVLPAGISRLSADFFRALGDRPVLGLHPGSVWGAKRWPAEYFARLAGLALKEGARVAVFAGPGEEEAAAEVRAGLAAVAPALKRYKLPPLSVTRQDGRSLGLEAAGADLLDFSASLDLPALAAFIARLGCYVGNDSGPMHLAWAQRIPVVALFGPTTPALGFAPRGEGAVSLEAGALPCRPCGLHGPRACPLGHHRCMRDLRPELVWSEARRRLYPG